MYTFLCNLYLEEFIDALRKVALKYLEFYFYLAMYKTRRVLFEFLKAVTQPKTS